MDYEKTYKEALKKAKRLYEQGTITESLAHIFPELKESDGEGIRKNIISFLRSKNGYMNPDEDWDFHNRWLPWLEKQGKQSDSDVKDYTNIDPHFGKPVEDLISKEKTADNVEAKFHEGDWVVWDNKITCHIDKVYHEKESLMYTITDTNNMVRSYSVKSFDNNARLWTIQDSKDGDVLAEDSCIFIIERMKPNGTAIVHCSLFDDGDFELGSTLGFDIDSTYPATKEQCDTLFKAMADAGYTFDFENKELKKLTQSVTKTSDKVWSEEDEEELGIAIEYLQRAGQLYSATWLKSLKERLSKR